MITWSMGNEPLNAARVLSSVKGRPLIIRGGQWKWKNKVKFGPPSEKNNDQEGPKNNN